MIYAFCMTTKEGEIWNGAAKDIKFSISDGSGDLEEIKTAKIEPDHDAWWRTELDVAPGETLTIAVTAAGAQPWRDVVRGGTGNDEVDEAIELIAAGIVERLSNLEFVQSSEYTLRPK